MGQNLKKLPCPKIQISDYPADIDFLQQMEVTVMARNHGGDTLGSILGPMGSHWVQKKGQNGKKSQCPKIRIFDYPAVIDFSQKMEVTVIAPNHSRDHPGSILGPMGPHWVKKWVKTVKNYCAAKFKFSTTLHSSIFPKNGSYGSGAKSWWGPLWSILGPMGSHWVQKLGENRKNYHAPKFEFSITPRSSIFPKKWKLRLWRQMTVRSP